jgi:hypothetical protein
MHVSRSMKAALPAVFLIVGGSGCSVSLDWDALTNGDGGSSACGEAACVPETLWSVPCHSVFVTADESRAFVTRYASTPEPPGLYLVDLASESPADAGELLKGDTFPGAGIVGGGSEVVFATRSPSGSVWAVGTEAPNTASEVSPGVDAFGVARSAAGDIYWVEREGLVHAVTAKGEPIEKWAIGGNPYYVAVNEEPESGGTIAYVAYNVGPEGQEEGQVARLSIGNAAEVVLAGLSLSRGIAVKMLARPDKKIVPHLFIATSLGAKMAWQEANLSYTVEHLGGAQESSKKWVPGEVAVSERFAYWTRRGDDGTGGDVFRKEHHGPSPAEKIGAEEQVPVGLALTGEALYWCTNSAQGLRRLALKDP